MSWEDKERVLRLLFAKINNVQAYVDILPQHSFSDQDQVLVKNIEDELNIVDEEESEDMEDFNEVALNVSALSKLSVNSEVQRG